MALDVMFRIVETHYAPPVDEFDNSYGEGETRVRLVEMKIVKRTAKGAWVEDYAEEGAKRFVLDSAVKRYADWTVPEAYKSFMERKRREIDIHKEKIKYAERAQRACWQWMNKWENDNGYTNSETTTAILLSKNKA